MRRSSIYFVGIMVAPALRLLLIGAAVYPFYAWGTPYLRVAYTATKSGSYISYGWCDYWGWHSFRAQGPNCPIVVWKEYKP